MGILCRSPACPVYIFSGHRQSPRSPSLGATRLAAQDNGAGAWCSSASAHYSTTVNGIERIDSQSHSPGDRHAQDLLPAGADIRGRHRAVTSVSIDEESCCYHAARHAAADVIQFPFINPQRACWRTPAQQRDLPRGALRLRAELHPRFAFSRSRGVFVPGALRRHIARSTSTSTTRALAGGDLSPTVRPSTRLQRPTNVILPSGDARTRSPVQTSCSTPARPAVDDFAPSPSGLAAASLASAATSRTRRRRLRRSVHVVPRRRQAGHLPRILKHGRRSTLRRRAIGASRSCRRSRPRRPRPELSSTSTSPSRAVPLAVVGRGCHLLANLSCRSSCGLAWQLAQHGYRLHVVRSAIFSGGRGLKLHGQHHQHIRSAGPRPPPSPARRRRHRRGTRNPPNPALGKPLNAR